MHANAFSIRTASIGLTILACIGAAVILYALRTSELRGDEVTYASAARAIADALTGRAADTSSVFVTVIERGWFMPGMAALCAPLFEIAPEAPNWALALYVACINAALFAAFVWQISPLVGARAALIFGFFPLLAPLWMVSAFSVLPDLPAGLLLANAMVLAWRIGTALIAGQAPRWTWIAGFEVCCIAALYLRGPMLLTGLGLHCILLALAGLRFRLLSRPMAGLALFAAALAPWSLAASDHFGAGVLTTTNFPLVIADGFGDPDRLCEGPCEPGIDILPAWEYAQARAAETGVHPFTQERAMMAASLEELTVRGYLSQVREHFGRFVFDPAGWLRFKLELSFAVPPNWRGPLAFLALSVTLIGYIPFIAALMVLQIVPVRASDSLSLQSILIKGMTFCLFLQPFLHKSSARYWVAFAALGTWSAIVLWQAIRAPKTSPARAMPAWLDAVQIAYGAVFAALAVAIALA